MMTEDRPGFGSSGAAAMGGEARARALTPSQRSAIARAAVATRWAREGKVSLPMSTHNGVLHIGNREIPCSVLDNGTRVLTQVGFMQAIGRSPNPKGGQITSAPDGLPPFLAADTIKPFVTEDLRRATVPVIYRTAQGNKAYGYEANLLPMVCEVYLAARDAGKTTSQQAHIVKACDILMRGLAHTGIIALVDEATGFQDTRPRDALAKILEAFIAHELRKWVRTFPPEFYKELFRLRGLPYPPTTVKRPGFIGHLTNDLVYSRLAPGVLDELKQKNPRKESGHRSARHHQWLTEDIGHPRLLQHLASVIALMKASDRWDQFKTLLDKALPKYQEMPLFKDHKDALS